MEEPYNNHRLFSKYYLDNYLIKNPEWGEGDHIGVFEEIKKIYFGEIKLLETYNEGQLREHFFNDIFKTLGLTYEVEEITKTKKYPDYGFFVDTNARNEAHKNKGQLSFYANSIGIGEVKQWNVNLDRNGKDEDNSDRNPSLQIWLYLQDTQRNWGILSNGELWRIYCKDKPRDHYYEINLPSLIRSDNAEAFKFFYYFFRKEAFISTKDGNAFLDRVLNYSIEYATNIGENLQENIYLAMKRIAEGFVERPSNHLDRNDPATLERVQKNTMILLYRFLFLLYAEGKDLLDLRDARYYELYSFHHITRAIPKEQYDLIKTTLQSEMKTLFDIINQGSDAFPIFNGGERKTKIPAYNGGLFDPKKHPDLEKWEIGNQYLADAIDLLSRSKFEDGHRDFIDYSTLEIRHLGSIYEGLLEYKLKVDESGHLCLGTDKDERKSTGSYYTPDYIVKYIVRNTIEPIVEEKWRHATENSASYIDMTLSIRVLDPAMGSGHFLVEAVEFLSQKLMVAMEKDSAAGKIADTSSYTNEWARRQVVSHCIYGVDLNDLAVELAKVALWLTTISRDKPLSFLDHRLKQGNSLIGAKISDLAWYPLGENKTGQKTIIPPVFVEKILDKILLIEKTKEENLEDIKKKEKIFNELQGLPEYQKVMQIADLNTSFYFGNKIETPTNRLNPTTRLPSSYYYNLVGSMYDMNQWGSRTNFTWFNNGLEIGKEISFFHWELEFPEIFFDSGKLRENPGWDVVIGNPPWEKISAQSPEKHFLDIKFQSIREGEINFYNLFLSQCYDLTKNEGSIGQIVPNTWLINKTSNLLRGFILLHYRIQNLHYLCKGVFEDAPDTIPVILDFVKQKQTKEELNDIDISVRVVNDELLKQPTFLSESIWEDFANQKTWFDRPLHQMSVFDTKRNQPFCKSIESNSITLNDLGHASDGIYKSTVEKFKKFDVKGDTKYRPVIESAIQVRRYEINWGGGYIPEELWSKHRELHTGEKIVLHAARKPKLKRRLVAAITEDFVFFSNRFIIIKIANSDYSPLYISSLLNSKTMNYYFKIRFPITDIDGYMLHQLPIRRISFSTSVDHRISFLNTATEMYRSYTLNGDSRPLLGFIDSRLAALPEESDIIHDLLAFLAKQMVEINNEKNAEIKEFLDFVESEIGIPIDLLSNKTLIQEYFAHDFTNFIDVLDKNKSKMKKGYNPKIRTHHDILKNWFNSSVGKLNPILGRICATDTLIDQIVFKLYGLSEEEIDIVERSLN